ncbi:hypothetical protein BDV18DRAFT_144955 [Aspergillus unguis]
MPSSYRLCLHLGSCGCRSLLHYIRSRDQQCLTLALVHRIVPRLHRLGPRSNHSSSSFLLLGVFACPMSHRQLNVEQFGLA